MTRAITPSDLDAARALLVAHGYKVTKPKPRVIGGEGKPGKRPAYWHGTLSSVTRRMVAAHGRFRDSKGVARLITVEPGATPQENDPHVIEAFYKARGLGLT